MNIPKAIEWLSTKTKLEAISSFWLGPAIGPKAPDFVNGAVCFSTPLTIGQLKTNVLRPIEDKLGRKRDADKFAPRPMDLDILVFDNEVIEPEVWDRAYLAIPLAELIPDLSHPQSKKTISQFVAHLNKESKLQKVSISVASTPTNK